MAYAEHAHIQGAQSPYVSGYGVDSLRGVMWITLGRNLGYSGNIHCSGLTALETKRYDVAPGTQVEGKAGQGEAGMTEARDVIAAVVAGDAAEVRALVAADRSLASARDEHGVSALMHALYRQRKDLAEVLRAGRPDLDVFEASSLGRADIVEELVERDRRLVYARSGDGFTALHFAAFFGEESVARVLLEHHADAGAVANNPMQVMPLHSAAAGRNLAIVRALLEHGAPVNARQEKGWTALHAAAQHGDRAMVELLLKYGANPNAKNDEGHTPDQVASEKGHAEIAERLRAA